MESTITMATYWAYCTRYVGSDLPTAAITKNSVFRNMEPYSTIKMKRGFEDENQFDFQGPRSWASNQLASNKLANILLGGVLRSLFGPDDGSYI
jgi:hypothetical protein